jgi:hypothetical protein
LASAVFLALLSLPEPPMPTPMHNTTNAAGSRTRLRVQPGRAGAPRTGSDPARMAAGCSRTCVPQSAVTEGTTVVARFVRCARNQRKATRT